MVCLPIESLDDYVFEVETSVSGKKGRREETHWTKLGSSSGWSPCRSGLARFAHARLREATGVQTDQSLL